MPAHTRARRLVPRLRGVPAHLLKMRPTAFDEVAMESTIHAACAFALALTAAAHAGAEPAPKAPPTSALPADTAYRSAFENYRPFRDEPLVSWQQTNNAMGALGGHMGHLRGSVGMGSMTRQPDVAAPTQSGEKLPMPGKPAEATSAGHGGHASPAPTTRPQ
jgi:hypothetical protein